MASAGKINVVISADTRPAVKSASDFADTLRITTAATARQRAAALESYYARSLQIAAEAHDALANRLSRCRPLRYQSRLAARRCRRLQSEARKVVA